ncbi:hypothetical protein BDQ17DRAFT_631139 [Cyathus striatus]|nr:hypothetical protein BDQ17DRAFT_631139 [Cyathus striatus]
MFPLLSSARCAGAYRLSGFPATHCLWCLRPVASSCGTILPPRTCLCVAAVRVSGRYRGLEPPESSATMTLCSLETPNAQAGVRYRPCMFELGNDCGTSFDLINLLHALPFPSLVHLSIFLYGTVTTRLIPLSNQSLTSLFFSLTHYLLSL